MDNIDFEAVDNFVGDIVKKAKPFTYKYSETKIVPPVVANIVTRVNFGIDIDLNRIVHHVPEAEYDPTKFAALIIRCGPPKSCALIFASGTCVINGLRTIHQLEVACEKYARILKDTGHPITRYTFEIQNAVVGAHISGGLDLDKISEDYPGKTDKKDNFPGLVFNLTEPKVTILVFKTGRFNIVGLRNHTQGHLAYEQMMEILPKYKLRAKPIRKEKRARKKPIITPDTPDTPPLVSSIVKEIVNKSSLRKDTEVKTSSEKETKNSLSQKSKKSRDLKKESKFSNTKFFDLRPIPKKDTEVKISKIMPNGEKHSSGKKTGNTVLQRLQELSEKHPDRKKKREKIMEYSRSILKKRGTAHIIGLNDQIMDIVSMDNTGVKDPSRMSDLVPRQEYEVGGSSVSQKRKAYTTNNGTKRTKFNKPQADPRFTRYDHKNSTRQTDSEKRHNSFEKTLKTASTIVTNNNNNNNHYYKTYTDTAHEFTNPQEKEQFVSEIPKSLKRRKKGIVIL